MRLPVIGSLSVISTRTSPRRPSCACLSLDENCRAFAPGFGAGASFFGSSFFFGSMSKAPIKSSCDIVTGSSSESFDEIVGPVPRITSRSGNPSPPMSSRPIAVNLRDLHVLLACGLRAIFTTLPYFPLPTVLGPLLDLPLKIPDCRLSPSFRHWNPS